MNTTANWENISVDTPLARLNVRHAGAGKAIVFWHNLFLSSEMWEEVGAELTNDYHVILIDGPGHGASGPLEKPFVMVDCARAAFQVLDALSEEVAIFAGSSWGGATCLEAALDCPERVSGIAVLNSTASGFTREQKKYFKGVAEKMQADGLTDAVLDMVVPMNFGITTLETRQSFVTRSRQAIQRADKDSTANTIISVLAGQQDYTLRFDELDLPILLLWGEEDHALPMDPYLKEMKDGLPNAAVVSVSKAGHAAPWERPQPVIDALRDFIRSIE